MDVSRREFLKASGGAALTGTALGGLAAVGANLAPTLARAQELRIKKARTTPSVCPYCSRCLQILDEWRLCGAVPAFGNWLVRGAPSDVRIADGASAT
jgi:anaerobic selenocysteine-containing dehydrogenase